MSVILYSQQPKKSDCGCKSNKVASTPPKTIAGMCQTCPKSDKGLNGGAVSCTINGKSFSDIVTASICPVGRFEQGTNATHWMGLTWSGVPEPLRWLLTHAKGRNVDLDGCGCITALKGSTLGSCLEPWLEGITQLRGVYGNLLEEMKGIVR